MSLAADFSKTTDVEVIGAPSKILKLKINGRAARTARGAYGNLHTTIKYDKPTLHMPDFVNAKWKWADSLPEAGLDYDDSAWKNADHKTSNNKFAAQLTPTALHGSEYGFHAGYLVYRGHFKAMGNETVFEVGTSGGNAFGHSVWIDGTYLGSWEGHPDLNTQTTSHRIPNLEAGSKHVIVVVVDNNGQEMNFAVGQDSMKTARGIRHYSLGETEIQWKITGNLGGEDYKDRVRGPLNEGGSYAERQGWHQPQPPSQHWPVRNPLSSKVEPGLGIYTTEFDLKISKGWDVPMDVVFDRIPGNDFRLQLYVNGWQFGKLIGQIGPQFEFPIPEGILNYRGKNTIAPTYWSQMNGTVPSGLGGLTLRANHPVLTGRPEVKLVKSPMWSKRKNAY